MRRRDGSNTFVGLESFITTGAQVRYACPKSQWASKKLQRACTGCDRAFHLFRWRHHCRVCGDLICNECSWTVYLVNVKGNVGRACYSCSRASSYVEEPRRTTWSKPHIKRPTCPSFVDSLTATTWIDSQKSVYSSTRSVMSSGSSWKQIHCIVCQRGFCNGDAVTKLPCNDTFHKVCLEPYLANHAECPACHCALPRDMAYIRSFFTFKPTLVDGAFASTSQVRAACPRSLWRPNASRTTCSSCDRSFHLFRRRHHCRVCGDLLCGACSWTVYLINARKNAGRACYDCARTCSDAPATTTVVDRPTCPNFVDALLETSWDEERPARCVMCTSVVSTGDPVTRLPCGDAFHSTCLHPWLASHDECPTCHDALPKDMAYIRKIFTFS
ncbi:hypothetical protein ACHHYP_13860 [Achlya hypogyna]|uniref:FYVE-type domain-containing protein n=1 Tax=Achlya hypogyna TaxID=1202772 RepID=A0A1V9YEI2_ACHHY|nr:hypothetical protein ACHHYP_13860 [Achlya hypogyna]